MPEEWRAGLCDGCYVTCCTPCAMGEVAQWTGRSWCLWTLYNYLLPCCAAAHLRGALRERQQISGGCCGDCMASLCCYPCATAQLYTECRSGAHEERKKQKRMEKMITIVYAAPPPPPPHYPQVYPVHQPVAVAAGAPYPPPSPSGKDAGYVHGANAAY